MPKDSGRARRRRDLARMIARTRRIRPDVDDPKKLADNLAACSCRLCGNPRRWWGEETRQERRWACVPLERED